MDNKKILIVDNDNDVCQMLDFVLKDKGYEVAVALSGVEALEKMKDFNPDLIVLDIIMPEMDGFEVCEKIRENDKKIKILMLTAKSGKEDRKKGLIIGADLYTEKPFIVNDLMSKIEGLLKNN